MFKKPMRIFATLTLVLVAVFASVASTDDENEATKVEKSDDDTAAVDTEAADAEEAGEDGPAESFGIGDTVALGDWELTVHSLTDPLEPTNEFLSPDEGNRWVSLDVEVGNNADSAENVSSILCFEIQDSENRAYDVALITGNNGASIDGEVAAGGSRRGDIDFEIPEAADGLRLNFKCDLFSKGSATIDLN